MPQKVSEGFHQCRGRGSSFIGEIRHLLNEEPWTVREHAVPSSRSNGRRETPVISDKLPECTGANRGGSLMHTRDWGVSVCFRPNWSSCK